MGSEMCIRDREAAMYLPYVAFALHAVSPTFTPETLLSGTALKLYPTVTTQGCFNYAYGATVDNKSAESSVRSSGWQNDPAVVAFTTANALGQAHIAQPLLLIAGDADQTVPYPVVVASVKTACQAKLPIHFSTYKGLDHDPTMDQSTPEQLAWVRARYAGEPATSNCPKDP